MSRPPLHHAPDPTHRLASVLREAGLPQNEFAALGGWLANSVNRWCRQRPSDARKVPRYALALALFYRGATPEQRQAVTDALNGTTTPDRS